MDLLFKMLFVGVSSYLALHFCDSYVGKAKNLDDKQFRLVVVILFFTAYVGYLIFGN